jgi:uncharacterized protein YjdB
MNHSTLHRSGSAIQPIVQSNVFVKAFCRSIFSNKNYTLVVLAFSLLLCGISNRASALITTYYYPTSITGTGVSATYCQGAAAAAMVGHIHTSSSAATGGVSSTVTWGWYYNTTGTAGTLVGATLVASGGPYTASAATVAANLPGASISTAVPGTYYYFLYVSWSGGTYPAGTLYSTLATITVNGIPGPITGALNACPGTTTALTDGLIGGVWTSSFPGVASVTGAGLVTGITPGTTTIVHSTGCGAPASVTVTINPNPAAITGTGEFCQGTTINLSDVSSPGIGTWSSSATPVATVNVFSGDVTGMSGGTSVISYTLLGCNALFTVTVDPLPGPIMGAFRECAGTSITLTDAIPGGTWSSSNVSIATVGSLTGVVTADTIAGTTIITYANTCGSVIAVDTVKAIPPIFAGTDSACVGSTTSFADLPLGGTWTSSNPFVASVLPGSGVITCVNAGTANITYTIPPGCFRAETVKINPSPAPITGTFNVCPGATTPLSDAVAGTWVSVQNYVAIVGATTGIVIGVMPDTARIIFTDYAGCSVSALVTVNPAPLAITGGNITCGASADTVYDATPGGSWYSSNSSVATIGLSTGIIATVNGGTSTISYTLPDGCAATKNIVVNSLPSATVTYDFVTNEFFTDTFYVTYQWYDSAQGLIPGANSYQTAALYDGNYWVVVTDTNGCTASGTPVHYNTNMAGVQNQAAAQLRVYPNPVTSILYIESVVRVRAVITSIDGKIEMEQADAKEINTGRLANGMYFLSLYNDNGARLMVQKLTKQ